MPQKAVQKERLECVALWKSMPLRQRALNAAALHIPASKGNTSSYQWTPRSPSNFWCHATSLSLNFAGCTKTVMKNRSTHFAMQLPLKLVFQELCDTFFKEMFILCYLPKGYGLPFLNNPQQRRRSQSWPDTTECLQWHVEIQLSAARSEVVRKIKAKIITLLMCSCFHLSTKQGS